MEKKFSGLLAAAIQYLGLLIMMFSSSFAQVYYNEIAQIKNPKALYKSYTYWLKRLFILTSNRMDYSSNNSFLIININSWE